MVRSSASATNGPGLHFTRHSATTIVRITASSYRCGFRRKLAFITILLGNPWTRQNSLSDSGYGHFGATYVSTSGHRSSTSAHSTSQTNKYCPSYHLVSQMTFVSTVLQSIAEVISIRGLQLLPYTGSSTSKKDIVRVQRHRRSDYSHRKQPLHTRRRCLPN